MFCFINEKIMKEINGIFLNFVFYIVVLIYGYWVLNFYYCMVYYYYLLYFKII